MTRSWLVLGVIALVGAALRVVGIDHAPPGLYYDEAANGIDALNVLDGHRPLFFVGNQGREPLHIYATALATALIGPGWLAVRLPSVAVGIATVPASYLFGRELGGRWVGVATALLLAVSYWHVHLSRLGFRAVWVPLVLALGLGCLLRAYRLDDRRAAALAGLAVGLGAYTYIAARLIPVLALAVAFVAWRHWRPRITTAILPFALAALVAAPMAAYFVRHPEHFWQRVENAAGGPVGPEERIGHALGVFLWAGDVQARHNFPERAVFEPIAGGLFLVGLALALRRWREPAVFATVSACLVMLMPQALSSGEPHFLRAVGLMPAAQGLAALGLVAVADAVRDRRVRAGLAGLLALAWLGLTVRDYFYVWAPSRETYVGFDGQGRSAAELARRAPDVVAQASPIYDERPTYYLGDPVVAFDPEGALVLPPRSDWVVLTADYTRRRAFDPSGAEEEAFGPWPDGEGRPPAVLRRVDPASMVPRVPLGATIGVVDVVGYDIVDAVRPGGTQDLVLRWSPRSSAAPGLSGFAHVVDSQQRVWSARDGNAFPSRQWRGGERVWTRFSLGLPTDTPSGAYWVSTGFYEGATLRRLPVVDRAGRPSGDRLLLGPFKVWDGRNAVAQPEVPLAVFEEGLFLAGVGAPQAAVPGEPLRFRLWWWASGPTAKPLTIFVHLLDTTRRERAGSDRQPLGGANPTSTWQSGELIEEEWTLAVPRDAPPGRYEVEVGLYDGDTGRRQPLRLATERLGDAAIVARVDVR